MKGIQMFEVLIKNPKPMWKIIYEIMAESGKPCSIKEMYERIRSKYPKNEINRNTVSTSMSDLSVNGPDSSGYSMEKRFLRRIGRGLYELIQEQNYKGKSDLSNQNKTNSYFSKPRISNSIRQKSSMTNWIQNKITILGEPYTFATGGEITWRQTMMETIPEKIEGNYSGAELEFHYVPHIHGQPLDVDNLCEPVFTILVGKKRYFGGARNNIQWFKAQKIPDTKGKLELKLSEKIPETSADSVIFDEIYHGILPKSATDKVFSKFVEEKTKTTLGSHAECNIHIQFSSGNINLGNISSGTVKPIIDCLYPVLGGILGNPQDYRIGTLLVEKNVRTILDNSVRIIISST